MRLGLASEVAAAPRADQRRPASTYDLRDDLAAPAESTGTVLSDQAPRGHRSGFGNFAGWRPESVPKPWRVGCFLANYSGI